MFDKRKSGEKEERGKVKRAVLFYIYRNEKKFTREDIATAAIESSRKALKTPLRQRQNFYSHISELVKKGLIKEDKTHTAYTYTVLDPTYANFVRICGYFMKINKFEDFKHTAYFSKTYQIIFKDILKDGFGIQMPSYDELQKHSTKIYFFCKLIRESDSATRISIFEPKKFKKLIDIAFECEKEVIDNLKKNEKKTKNKETNLYPKKLRTELNELHSLIDKLKYSLVIFYHIDIMTSVFNTPYSEINGSEYENRLKELMAKRKQLETELNLELSEFQFKL